MTGFPVAGPSAGLSTLISAPLIPATLARTCSIVILELWARSLWSSRSRVRRLFALTEPKDMSVSETPREPTLAMPCSRSEVSRVRPSSSVMMASEVSRLLPLGTSTSTQISRGFISGKNSAPWPTTP